MSAPQSSEPNPIRFSDEPQFGTVHPSQTAVPPTRVRQPSDGEFATHPSAIQTPVTSAQKESFCDRKTDAGYSSGNAAAH